MRKLLVLMVLLVPASFVTATATAAIPEVFDGRGDISCTVQGPGASEGQRWCGTGSSTPVTRSTATSFDGVPIDVNVAFPKAPASGPDGPYPLMMIFHGYAGSKSAFAGMQRWLNRGYAVFSMTDRGFHESCGSLTSRLAAGAACDEGFLRLLDTRYEVRDAQVFAALLADENRVIPNRIAATGGSYGGGLSMALAALKNRTMLPDGSLVPWKSPDGRSMELAVAIPSIPWTDLAYSLVPNGSTLDYLKDSPYFGPFGVMKESWVNLLYTLGLTVGEGNYALPGQSPSADLTSWKALLDAGEPYDGKPAAQSLLDEITAHHSSYYIDHSVAPAPIHITSGFTDDLFPVDEATRFYNRTRAEHPDSRIGLFFGPNSGHMRGQNKPDVTAAQAEIENRWVDHYLKGAGAAPPANVTAFLQTCPAGDPAGEPITAKDWASIAPGEIRLSESNQQQTVDPLSGDAVAGGIFNPAPTGMACSPAPGGEEAGSANWELPPAPKGGYTVLGAPTVVADFTAGKNSQVAARLVDVSPNGLSKTLIARGLWRPSPGGTRVFQLHANGYRVEEGHVARLELLTKDASLPAGGILNYGRPSNGQTAVTVKNLDLRVPVAEKPGSPGGFVTEPAAKVLPKRPGAALAPGYSTGSIPVAKVGKRRLTVLGPLKARGHKLRVRVRCGKSVTCPKATIVVRRKGAVLAARKGIRVKSGRTRVVKLKLTRKARRLFGAGRSRGLRRTPARVTIRTAGFRKKTVARTIKRSGRVR
ncbi:MAG: acetylxylan esterase [Actinomycetota bacterium]|nr:acetylxylan esterase [Actinomycetota bacterium]